MKKIVISLLFTLITPGSTLRAAGPSPLFIDATGADNFKLLFIPKAHEPITIDGKLSESSWDNMKWVDDFGHCNFGARRCDYPKTEFKYLWDDKYLYLAFRCYESNAENMKRHQEDVMDKSQPIYNRDCIELHIDGNNDNATRFQVWFIDTKEKMIFWHYDFGWGILVNENYGSSADWDYGVS